MKFFTSCIVSLFLFTIASSEVIYKNSNPGSLYTDELSDPLLDRVARRKGDIITILISESSVANFTANTSLSKADNSIVQAILKIVDFDKRFPISTTATSKNDGKGTTNQNSSMRARLTGTVKEVLPCGRLCIEACRSLIVNREKQRFLLKGVIRLDDIAPDNTVLSEKIAEAEIKLFGEGAIHDRQRRGILTRLLDWLF